MTVERLALQDWMTEPAVAAVIAALEAEGGSVRFVGGCVRDALAGHPVGDIDLATPDPPERVTEKLEAAGLKAVPTGIRHGTVTAVADGRPFEVTTLREDVETDGRHAKVAFTDSWEADAARRDLTINAMSLTPDGRLFDPFGGRADLAAGRVRFVGEARLRITEDYLRLLRFFRFHALYGQGPPDPEGLAAALDLAPQLARLSEERVRDELLKLLAAPDPGDLVALMLEKDILAAVLPEAGTAMPLQALIALEQSHGIGPDGLLRFAALVKADAAGLEVVARRLRLSNRHRTRIVEARRRADDGATAITAAVLYRVGAGPLRDALLLAWAAAGAEGKPSPRAAVASALTALADWRPRHFPLRGDDGLALGLAPGPALGRLLAEVEAWWLERDAGPDRAACLAELRRRAAAQARR